MMIREETSVRYEEGVTPIWGPQNKSESDEKAKKKADQKADKCSWDHRMNYENDYFIIGAGCPKQLCLNSVSRLL